MNESLITLISLPALEETLVDWLLEREELSGFSSLRIDGHGSYQHSLSLAEQVTGRQRKVMFLIHLPSDAVAGLLQQLRRDFPGTGMHYWVTPLLEAGRLE
ncbi:MAG: DUF3240 family protein [Pseudomonadota bacterium]